MNNQLAAAPDFDPAEYDSLTYLERGDVDIWLRRRGIILKEKAKYTQYECEGSKTITLAVVAICSVLSANPLMMLPMTGALAFYGYTVFHEKIDTGKFKPFPFFRGGLFDILGFMQGEGADTRHPIEDETSYLSEAEENELLLLYYRFGELAKMLAAAPPKARFDLYRFVVDQHFARLALPEQEELESYISAVSSERRMKPLEAAQESLEEVEDTPQLVDEVSAKRREKGEKTPFFNWEDLKDSDVHPVIGIVGGQGAGKSRLVKYLVKHICCGDNREYDAIAFDIFSTSTQWGFEVSSSVDEIILDIENDLDLIDIRTRLFREGERDFTPVFRIFEESRDCLPELRAMGQNEAKALKDWQRKFGSVTRKLNARVIYINTQFDAEAMGMKANERNAVTLIFPGFKGISAAMSDTQILKLGANSNSGLRNKLNRLIAQVTRAALIFHEGKWLVGVIPELTEEGDLK